MLVTNFTATRFNVLPRLRIVPYCHSFILEIDPVAPLDIDYFPVEYCFDRGFNFLSSNRSEWTRDMTIPLRLLDVYADGSKLDCGVRSIVYSRRFDLKILLRLPAYCSVFQAEVIAIYRPGWIFANGVSFVHISIVSDSQAAIISVERCV